MTTTLGPWQIVVLTLLILSLAVILKRTVTLIALVRTRNWYAQNPVQTEASESSLPRSDSDENRSTGIQFAPQEEWFDDSYGGTGYTPNGVSFVPAVPAKHSVAKRLVPGRRKRRGRRR